MATHTSRVYLSSCLKVPIDPCNNCPAPIYNRPKMYLGRLTTPHSTTTTTRRPTTDANSETEHETVWTCSGVRSLAKLYDSIPDYSEINHLEEADFYSTLDTLRSACRELRTPAKPVSTRPSSASLSTSSATSGGLKDKTKKSKKKPQSSTAKKKANRTKVCGEEEQRIPKAPMEAHTEEKRITLDTSWRMRQTPCNVVGYKQSMYTRSGRPKDYKKECEDEVAAFKRTLREFEEELKHSSYVESSERRAKTSIISRDRSASNLTKIAEDAREDVAKSGRTTEKRNNARPARNKLRKSFSFNDIHIADTEESTRSRLLEKIGTAETFVYKDPSKLSNYFAPKQDNDELNGNSYKSDLPQIVVTEIPSPETTTSSKGNSANLRGRRKSKSKKLPDNFKLPFSIFNLSSDSKKDSLKKSPEPPSPQHPVARPNLAATLRVEVSKKKLKELQDKCSYQDVTPPVDWEVRKTPAWKSLSLNETHKQILALRLATRKAEQELQQREYDLNMQLMRQRVKSAPLLLEGTTYWGPSVGKLTHTCQTDGTRHACHQGSLQRKQRKKSGGGSRRCGSDCGGGGSRLGSKLHSLRKIYANSASSCSRQSQRSAASDGATKRRYNRPATPAPTADEGVRKTTVEATDSGDDLCSVDRAYL